MWAPGHLDAVVFKFLKPALNSEQLILCEANIDGEDYFFFYSKHFKWKTYKIKNCITIVFHITQHVCRINSQEQDTPEPLSWTIRLPQINCSIQCWGLFFFPFTTPIFIHWKTFNSHPSAYSLRLINQNRNTGEYETNKQKILKPPWLNLISIRILSHDGNVFITTNLH